MVARGIEEEDGLRRALVHGGADHDAVAHAGMPRIGVVDDRPINGDTFSISALHLAIKVPYFSNSGRKNEKVTSYLGCALQERPLVTLRRIQMLCPDPSSQARCSDCASPGRPSAKASTTFSTLMVSGMRKRQG
eukprot:SAG31_NODE_1360_length_8638_cov_55.988055_2_plen_134_part_00